MFARIAVGLAALVSVSPVFAQGIPPTMRIVSGCLPQTIRVCGSSFVAERAPLGSTQTFALPEQFITRYFSVQCVKQRGVQKPFYKLVDETIANCELKSCEPGPVSICDTTVDIPSKTPFGDRVRVSVPEARLSGAYKKDLQTFMAQCVMDRGALVYKVVNAFDVSCSAFLCLPVSLSVCRSTVSVSKPAEFGAVLRLLSEDNQPVQVRCLSLGGNAPKFVVTDHRPCSE